MRPIMQRNRRQNIRVAARLPCLWRGCESVPQPTVFASLTGLPQAQLDSAQNLHSEVENALADVVDPPVRHVLDLLRQQINHLQATRLELPDQDIELSSDFVKISCTDPQKQTGWAGVIQHKTLICLRGRVVRQDKSADGGYRQLIQLQDTSSREQTALMRLIYELCRPVSQPAIGYQSSLAIAD